QVFVQVDAFLVAGFGRLPALIAFERRLCFARGDAARGKGDRRFLCHEREAKVEVIEQHERGRGKAEVLEAVGDGKDVAAQRAVDLACEATNSPKMTVSSTIPWTRMVYSSPSQRPVAATWRAGR